MSISETTNMLQDVWDIIQNNEDYHLDAVQDLLDFGADPTINDNEGTLAAFQNALVNDHLDVVQDLLDIGADPTINDNEGQEDSLAVFQNASRFV